MLQRKPLLWVILSLLFPLLLTNVLYADALPFTDVKADVWYYDDVKEAYQKKLINGKTDTLFAPEDKMTAAEAVKLAACMHQLKNEGTVSLSVGVGTWYQPYLDYARDKGIITTELNWNQNITRAGYMQIFARLIKDEETTLNDVPDDFIPDVKMTHPNSDAIYKLYRAGIVRGVDRYGNCAPYSLINRSEVAAILTRMMNESSRITFRGAQNLIITEQPKNAKGRLGSRVNLKVVVRGGKAPLSYKWEYFDEAARVFKKSTSEGNTTNILKAPVEAIAYKYRCVISDANGRTVISDIARVECSDITITKQPVGYTGNLGERANLKVEATGGKAPLTYVWNYRKLGTEKFIRSVSEGAATNVLKPPVEETPGEYRCIIRDARGMEVISDIAIVKMRADSFRFKTQPIDMGALEGQEVMLGVEVTGGSEPYKYQWAYSENGRTNFFLSTAKGNNTNVLKVAAYDKVYYYYCTVSDRTGKKIDSKVVKVESVGSTPFKISRQPQDVRANPNENVTLQVEVTGGKKPYTYQWQTLQSMKFINAVYNGNKTDKLNTKVFEPYRLYRCIISDSSGHRTISDTVAVRSRDYIDYRFSDEPQNTWGNLGEEVKLQVGLYGKKYTNDKWMSLEFKWFYLEDGGRWYKPSGAPGNDTTQLRVKVKDKPYEYIFVIYDADDSYKEVLMSKPVRVQKRRT